MGGFLSPKKMQKVPILSGKSLSHYSFPGTFNCKGFHDRYFPERIGRPGYIESRSHFTAFSTPITFVDRRTIERQKTVLGCDSNEFRYSLNVNL